MLQREKPDSWKARLVFSLPFNFPFFIFLFFNFCFVSLSSRSPGLRLPCTLHICSPEPLHLSQQARPSACPRPARANRPVPGEARLHPPPLPRPAAAGGAARPRRLRPPRSGRRGRGAPRSRRHRAAPRSGGREERDTRAWGGGGVRREHVEGEGGGSVIASPCPNLQAPQYGPCSRGLRCAFPPGGCLEGPLGEGYRGTTNGGGGE